MSQGQAAESLRHAGRDFEVILADPPWRFASNSESRPGKNAMGHYACMKLDEIAALPVREVAARDALLLLWVTVPFVRLAFDVIDAWGFKYVSEVVWVKERIGTGFWVRNRHEPLLICKRGRFPCPKPALFPDSVIEGQQRQHSRKPDRVHEIVDDRLPGARKLEMFARETRPGWAAWGDETTKFDRRQQVHDMDALLGDPGDDLEALLA